MSKPINIPNDPHRLFDVSPGPDAPLNQMLRWLNEVRSGVWTFKQRSGFAAVKPLRYGVFGWKEVDTLADGIIEEGANVQAAGFWRHFVSEISTVRGSYLKSIKQDDDETNRFAGIGSESPLPDPWPTYDSMLDVYLEAGISGLQRRRGEDVDDITMVNGTDYGVGDIIGPWIVRDLARVLSALQIVRIDGHTGSQGKSRIGNWNGRTFTWNQAYQYVRFTGFANWETIRDITDTSVLYRNASYVSGRTPSGRYGGGQASTVYNGDVLVDARGYKPADFQGELRVYGVARSGVFSTFHQFNNAGPFSGVAANGYPVFLGSMEAPSPSSERVAIPCEVLSDISTAGFPWDDHGLNGPADTISVGMVINQPMALFYPVFSFHYEDDE